MPTSKLHKLTDFQVRAAKPAPNKKSYKLSDGGGLLVIVQPNGSKYLRYKYRVNGKERALALGVFPETGLKVARELRDAAKEQLRQGLDPTAEKRKRKAQQQRAVDASQQSATETFEVLARDWYAKSKKKWSVRHAGYVLRRMEHDLFPAIGAVPIKELDAPTILAALRKIEKRGAHEMARRCKQYVSATFRYAIANGKTKRNPATDLADALAAAPPQRHSAAISERDLPEFFRRLREYDGDPVTALAVRLLMLTAVRTSELLGARWTEIEGSTWRIPAERMKMSREHVVPLSTQALAVLKAARKLNPETDLVFPAPRDDERPMSGNTILFALYRMGYHGRATGHGMRTLFSTVLNEQGYEADYIERQLAHVSGGVRAAYNRASWLPQRTEMMQWWGDWLQKQERKPVK